MMTSEFIYMLLPQFGHLVLGGGGGGGGAGFWSMGGGIGCLAVKIFPPAHLPIEPYVVLVDLSQLVSGNERCQLD